MFKLCKPARVLETLNIFNLALFPALAIYMLEYIKTDTFQKGSLYLTDITETQDVLEILKREL